MPVYVDDMFKYELGRYGNMKMSHLIADTHEELVQMADRIGVARRWLQHPGRAGDEHFDIAMSKRALAVQCGAKELTLRQLARMTIDRSKDPEFPARYFGPQEAP